MSEVTSRKNELIKLEQDRVVKMWDTRDPFMIAIAVLHVPGDTLAYVPMVGMNEKQQIALLRQLTREYRVIELVVTQECMTAKADENTDWLTRQRVEDAARNKTIQNLPASVRCPDAIVIYHESRTEKLSALKADIVDNKLGVWEPFGEFVEPYPGFRRYFV